MSFPPSNRGANSGRLSSPRSDRTTIPITASPASSRRLSLLVASDRPICKIQAKRGAASTVFADVIKAPEWWHSTRIIQAFDQVLQEKFNKPSLFKRISSFGSYKRPPQLSAAERLIQLPIRKRATAFVDARDDLETKIGRLSRRLNFLMTESDLWRDKLVTFEQYAEKLSMEAQDLRAKLVCLSLRVLLSLPDFCLENCHAD